MVYMHFRRPFTLRVHIMLAQRQLWGNCGSFDTKWNRKRVVNADTGNKWDDASITGFMILAASKGGKFQIITP